MTTEYGKSDASRAAERRGLSRRQMIKASAVAGAAAWTAPVIVDSLASPAAATSGVCKPYFVKLQTDGGVSHNCPGSGTGLVVTAGTPMPTMETSVSFNVSDSGWAGGAPTPGGCGFGLTASANVPGLASDGTFWKVTLPKCTFSTGTDWQIGGRYDAFEDTERFMKVVDGPTSTNSYGYFTNNGTTAWIPKTYPKNIGSVSKPYYPSLTYVYIKMCCS